MKLVLTEEQEFLRDTAKDFAQERTPVTHFRALRDNKDKNLWDRGYLARNGQFRLVWNTST
jgi:hypothetical protein